MRNRGGEGGGYHIYIASRSRKQRGVGEKQDITSSLEGCNTGGGYASDTTGGAKGHRNIFNGRDPAEGGMIFITWCVGEEQKCLANAQI